jgi:hypothetical protein
MNDRTLVKAARIRLFTTTLDNAPRFTDILQNRHSATM